MKLRNVCSLAGLLLAVSAVQVNAWTPCFRVVCKDTGAVVPGTEVVVTLVSSGDCKDFTEVSAKTDDKGEVCITVCESPACYVATALDSSTPQFCLTDQNPSPTIEIDVSCAGGPGGGCPECIAPELGLGVAAGCTVLELSTAKVSITGPAGGILGDICIAPGGSLAMSGDEFVTGTVNLGPGAKFSNSSHGTVNVAQNVDLSAEIKAAYDANAAAADPTITPCTQSFAKLDGQTVTKIEGVSGVNVICVGDVVLSGKQILITGDPGAKFIFNVTGKFVLTGGGAGPQIRVDGVNVKPSDVLYNIIGSGADVAFSGGGGGVNCCAAIVDGTLLAPYRKINLSPGLVNGEVISGKDINIVSGSSVRCPPCPK